MLFYDGFEAAVIAFAAKTYGLGAIESATATEAASAPRFEFNALGNVCLVRRGSDGNGPSAEARELFRRSQLLLLGISDALRAQGASLRDHALLEQLFNGNASLGVVDRKERRFTYRAGSAEISAELIMQALGGVAPLPILKAVIGGLGEEVRIAVSERRSDQRIAHALIVVDEAIFPTAYFTLFGIKASEIEAAGDFNCFRASATDISFSYDQQTWMLLDRDLLSPDSSDEKVATLAQSFVPADGAESPAGSDFSTDEPPAGGEAPDYVADALDEVSQTLDLDAEPEPEDGEEAAGIEAPRDFSVVRWPSQDRNAPDYAYLADVESDASFTLDGEVLKRLLAANRYEPQGDAVAIALRGAVLQRGTSEENRSSIGLTVTRPDHRQFRCVVGFWFRNEDRLTLFTGSTVPNRKAISDYAAGGAACNMLPTGLYSYYVWRHRTLKPALRLSSGNRTNGELELGAQVTVLRSTNDTILGTQDKFDPSRPLDNVHCSYYLQEQPSIGAAFSSLGCLTVRGTKTPTHEWKSFQEILSRFRSGSRIDLLLATGKDAALAATGLASKLIALRQGSTGEEVKRVQAKLGIGQTGYFGPVTVKRFTDAERELNRQANGVPSATGILTSDIASRLGWDIFASG